ncbi:DUF3540 domain-containing protein [Roseomonas eburnea]|uniref:DUF3540 domain-containing protein n=1 Tax=Neoroseomonas eburnea TaxID=1346889 RepID=A0A9X9XDE7_9PROT|nr:DUF3540 domain-containing protein [Neoroseomonas eburnea]MBR0681733.1 DUF3540 domain-containing protein [Neoroseomonas eburnea]
MNAITGMTGLAMADTEAAEVLARDGDAFAVRLEGREAPARRAFSCLVEPEPGDIVLLGRAGSVRYILAVLERPGAAPMRLALPDGATLAADGGRLNLSAGTLVMEAETTQLATKALGVTARKADANLGRASLVAEAIESLAERIIGRFRRSYRFIEESEQLRARDIDQRASGHLHLRGETANLQAGVLVKLHGSQIHLG